MKTRDEQIEDAANERYPKIHPAWAGTENEAFINGAEWADTHPPEKFLTSIKAGRDLVEIFQNEIIDLKKEVERLSAKLTIPEEEILAKSKKEFPCEPPCDSFGVCSNCGDALVYRVGVRWALEYLNAQRKGGG